MSATSVLMVINTTGLQYDDRLRKEVGSLRALGHDISILGLEYANTAASSCVYGDVPATTIRLRSRGWFPQGRGLIVKTAEMYLRFLGNVMARRPAVVWCHDLEMGAFVPLLAVLRAVGLVRRVVWDQHELPSDELREKRSYRKLFTWLINRCDAIVMANQQRRALVLEWLGAGVRPPIEVLNNYPDATFGELPIEALPPDVVEWLHGSPYLLAQGGANPDRHLGSLAAAVVQMPHLKLVVVGPFQAHVVETLRKQHGDSVGSRVLFTGPVPQMELARYIDHAFASVILYEADSANRVLCAPNRLFQALARRVPVIVGANPPMGDVVNAGHCGVVLRGDGKDIEDLCDGIRRLEAGYARFRTAAAASRDLKWESQQEVAGRIVTPAPLPATETGCQTVCLLPVATDARIQRRLAALEKLGVSSAVLAFERPYYPGKPFPGGYDSLGRIEHGRYLSRLRPLLSAIPKVRSACAKADVVYAFSLDLLALAWLATLGNRQRPRFVYEVADIHPTLVGQGLRPAIMRAIERKLLREASLLVVTSEAFVTGFFRDIQGVTGLRYQLVENKPDLDPVQAPPSRPGDGQPHITIGYFGVLRCERSWRTLRRLAEQGDGRVRVYLRGVPLNIPDFEAEARQSPWVEYGGPYVAPDELQAIYDRVDVLWVAHRVDENNSLLWNRTNRFYEGCAFQKPMIAQAGTQDGAVVAQRGLGPLIDLLDPDAVVDAVSRITPADLERWRANMSRLPRSVYRENGEHEQLTRRILALTRAS